MSQSSTLSDRNSNFVTVLVSYYFVSFDRKSLESYIYALRLSRYHRDFGDLQVSAQQNQINILAKNTHTPDRPELMADGIFS